MLNWIVWNGTILTFKLNSFKMGQIEINRVLILNWFVWNRTGYMYKIDLTLNNLQWLTCYETKPNQPINFIATFQILLKHRKIFDSAEHHEWSNQSRNK